MKVTITGITERLAQQREEEKIYEEKLKNDADNTEVKKCKYISEVIGDEYKNWYDRRAEELGKKNEIWKKDLILISSQTGSGKTFFILNVFLPYAQKNKKRILYLVNRKILKNQLLKEVNFLPTELRNSIEIVTYQSLEETLINSKNGNVTEAYKQGVIDATKKANSLFYNNQQVQQEIINEESKLICHKHTGADKKAEELASFDIVVCDEAQYFINESNYNRNTVLSYNFIRKYYNNKLKIFLSATIEEWKEYLLERWGLFFTSQTEWFRFDTALAKSMKYGVKLNLQEYKVPKDFSYINLHFFYFYSDIIDAIKMESGKWLFFVDSKKTGRKILNELKKSGIRINKKSEDLEFQDSDDEKNFNDKDENRKVRSAVFVTSEYNEDAEATSEVQSIVDNEKQVADVLICTSVLDNGVNLIDKELRKIVIMADNEIEFLQMLGRRRRDEQQIEVYAYIYEKKHFQDYIKKNNEKKSIAQQHSDCVFKAIEKALLDNSNGLCQSNPNEIEQRMNLMHSKKITEQIFDNFNSINSTYLSYNGMFYVNPFSVRNLENRNRGYKKIVDAMEKGEKDVFEREIITWLELEEETIKTAKLTPYERAVKKVCDKFNEKLGNELNAVDCAKIKDDLKMELRLILRKNESCISTDDYRKLTNVIDKSKKVMSEPFMQRLAPILGKPYIITVKKGMYTISMDKGVCEDSEKHDTKS